ncbi:MAG: efflux RND transporter periplasmic adaptor subunit [Bacteroidales bacterium]|nr:efflux RND transporter periplasmic adaptor subunit [Bacteroidales bacterium]
MKKLTIQTPTIILALFLGMVLYGCSSNEASSENNSAHEDHSAHNHEAEAETNGEDQHSEAFQQEKAGLQENEVLITGKQMKAAGIELSQITRQPLSKAVKSFGEVALAPSDEATVSTLIGGIIKDIRVIEGDYVRKGQVIARIVHPDIVDLQQNYLDASNQDEYLKLEYQRQKRLLEDSVNAEKTVQNARAAYQSNLARLQSLKKKLQLIHINPQKLTPQNIRDGYPVKAPITGHVAKVEINTGSHVTPQQSLFHVTANEKAHIDLKVYEQDISKVTPGQQLTFNLANSPLSQPMEGEVMKTAKRFDPEQRTALVHARIKDMREPLLPGMSVVAYIQTGDKEQNTLPDAAFVLDQGKNYVFMLKRKGKANNDNHKKEAEHAHQQEETQHEHDDNGHAGEASFFVFEKMLVRKGITQGAFSSFTTDKQDINTTRFVVNNAQAILSEMKKGAGGHSGHAH